MQWRVCPLPFTVQPNTALHEFSQRWRVRELALFGSVLRPDFHSDSDVDLLVSAVPTTCWTAEKEPAALQRRKLFATLAQTSVQFTPTFPSWAELWVAVAEHLGQTRRILVLDELSYAIESDPATLSALQHAWNHRLWHTNTIIVLCGSQVQTMVRIQTTQSPLFGRLTGQWQLDPLPFSALRAFFPAWSTKERIALSAVVGTVPAYLEWLDPERSFADNMRHHVLSPGSIFSAEPALLLYDEVREPQPHLAILKAIGTGAHTLDAIAKPHLAAYLTHLQDLRFVERRLPATLTPAQQLRSHRGRYHLTDPILPVLLSLHGQPQRTCGHQP